MDRRVLLTVAISMGILLVWTRWIAPTPPPPPAVTSPAPAATPGATPTAGDPTTAAAPGAPGAPGVPGAAPKSPAVRRTIERPGLFRAVALSWGAALAEWHLLGPKFTQPVDGVQQPINLVRNGAMLTTSFDEASLGLDAAAAWTELPSPSSDELAYAWDSPQLHVEKRLRFVPGTYQVQMAVSVENKSDQQLDEHLVVGLAGHQDPNVHPGGMFSARVIQTSGMCYTNGKLKEADLTSLLKQPVNEVGQVHWVGIDEKYFLGAVAAEQGDDAVCRVSATPDGNIAAQVRYASRRLAAKQKVEYRMAAFFGPKVLAELDAVTVGGQDAKLGYAIDYGMWGLAEWIARPMLAVLKAVHVAVPNWGLAVIALTILLKAITWWPTTKSMKSMKAMAKLKPEMDKLKEKYGEDKQRMNVEVMELYKKHGISPFGGCLPMLIQMPIYIALYSMLGKSVELYHANFIGWIRDLTAPDPYFVLPLATGALMFAQQRLSPASPDPNQKAMMYMMPVMFTAFSIFLPAGLTVYILTNTLLTMVQQWWMNRHDTPPAKLAAKPARA